MISGLIPRTMISTALLTLVAPVAPADEGSGDPSESRVPAAEYEHSPEPPESTDGSEPAGDPPDDAPAQERGQPPASVPAGFEILSVDHGGKGCLDPGSVSVALSGDRKTLRVIYDALRLERPGGAKLQYTSCTVSVKVQIPAGWQVSPTAVNMQGHAHLDAGIEGRQTSRYFVAGEPIGTNFQNDFSGYIHRGYRITRVIPADAAVWSPCGGPAILAIQGGLRLDARDNLDGEASLGLRSQRLSLWKWRKC